MIEPTDYVIREIFPALGEWYLQHPKHGYYATLSSWGLTTDNRVLALAPNKLENENLTNQRASKSLFPVRIDYANPDLNIIPEKIKAAKNEIGSKNVFIDISSINIKQIIPVETNWYIYSPDLKIDVQVAAWLIDYNGNSLCLTPSIPDENQYSELKVIKRERPFIKSEFTERNKDNKN
ncbi:hypothetical protein [Providencia burhodogranariea]|uniref:Uncharacterized protein n=1 Tax=Providencia burhodogranariea DSM 19968 TaxID=1141662 RepID=K8WNZ7_9GAMM|nr:hypothetical protein [Providencia burhodogranariea]EKT62328.1 hypothetical protein OOA_08767 [Providencia burhodogranariea DSM 19968]